MFVTILQVIFFSPFLMACSAIILGVFLGLLLSLIVGFCEKTKNLPPEDFQL